MLSEAIKKLQDEMVQNVNNPYIQGVGQFLTHYINRCPDAADKILTEGKTIGNSLGEMRKVAEKKKVGNCAVLTAQEGFDIVLKYFGIDTAIQSCELPKMDTEIKEPIKMKEELDSGLNFDIEDFL